MNEIIRDDQGTPIAYATRGGCENPRCKIGIADNRPYHVIPHVWDPRGEIAHLVLPDWHFASIQEGVDAIEKGWNTAETVDNPIDRDKCYKRRVPVKILKNTGNF